MQQPENLQDKTVCFLLRRSQGSVQQVLLGRRKGRFGRGLLVGIGGKVGDQEDFKDETVEEAVAREVEEEIGVAVRSLLKVGEVAFLFPQKEEWSQRVHVFTCEDWEGDPGEGEEIRPEWFTPTEVPYEEMWDDAQYWLPLVLEGQLLRATFVYDEGNSRVIEKDVRRVDSL